MAHSRRNLFSFSLPALLFMLGWSSGCVSPQMSPQAEFLPNPVFIAVGDQNSVWEATVDVLHSLQLPVENENKLDGVIETDYKVGASLLEPWHHDAVTMEDRLEGSFQSIRRRAAVSITPAQGGFYVGVEVQKELEDPDQLIINSPGYATFEERKPLQRDLDVVIGPATQEGWIVQGRDPGLEQLILSRVQASCGYQ